MTPSPPMTAAPPRMTAAPPPMTGAPPPMALIPDNMVVSTLGGRSSGSSRASN
jgi:hypothetical protein